MKLDIKKYLTISALVIAVQINAADLSIQSYKQHWRWQQSGVDKNVIDNFLELFDDYQQPLAQRFSTLFEQYLHQKRLLFPDELKLKILNRANLDISFEVQESLKIPLGGSEKSIRVENLNNCEFVKLHKLIGKEDVKSGEQIIYSFTDPARKFDDVLPYIQCWILSEALKLNNDVADTSKKIPFCFHFDKGSVCG